MFGNERHGNQVQHAAHALVLAAHSRTPVAIASYACVTDAPAMTWPRCGPGPDTR